MGRQKPDQATCLHGFTSNFCPGKAPHLNHVCVLCEADRESAQVVFFLTFSDFLPHSNPPAVTFNPQWMKRATLIVAVGALTCVELLGLTARSCFML